MQIAETQTALTEPLDERTSWARRLRVDERHPFFFDHPLDHVPGILLVAGLLSLAREVLGDEPAGPRLRLALRFPAFCEIGTPILMSAEQTAPSIRGHLTVGATQTGTVVCEGWIGSLGRPQPPVGFQRTRAVRLPARPDLVHRHRAENVVISGPEEVRGHTSVSVLTPPDSHFLHRCGEGRHSSEKIIEAARQFTTMLPLTAGDHPVHSKLVWTLVAVDLPWELSADVPIELRWRTERTHSPKYRYHFEVVNGSSRIGHIVSECAVFTESAYRVLRGEAA